MVRVTVEFKLEQLTRFNVLDTFIEIFTLILIYSSWDETLLFVVFVSFSPK